MQICTNIKPSTNRNRVTNRLKYVNVLGVYQAQLQTSSIHGASHRIISIQNNCISSRLFRVIPWLIVLNVTLVRLMFAIYNATLAKCYTAIPSQLTYSRESAKNGGW